MVKSQSKKKRAAVIEWVKLGNFTYELLQTTRSDFIFVNKKIWNIGILNWFEKRHAVNAKYNITRAELNVNHIGIFKSYHW